MRSYNFCCLVGFSPSSVGKESACNAGDLGSIPGSGRFPGEGNGNPLQYPCLENPMDRGAWWATVHGVARVGHDVVTKLPPNHHISSQFMSDCNPMGCSMPGFPGPHHLLEFAQVHLH